MLFDHCAVCQQCCNVEAGYPPLEITLTRNEQQKLGSVCIEQQCTHLGPQGCTMGDDKPFGCKLYPLSYNPKNKSFYFDADCPLMDPYMADLQDANSDASLHFNSAQQVILQLEKKDPAFLKNNHAVDKMYFDLKKIPIARSSKKTTTKT
jgi:Fe-S-cluster containining protein